MRRLLQALRSNVKGYQLSRDSLLTGWMYCMWQVVQTLCSGTAIAALAVVQNRTCCLGMQWICWLAGLVPVQGSVL